MPEDLSENIRDKCAKSENEIKLDMVRAATGKTSNRPEQQQTFDSISNRKTERTGAAPEFSLSQETTSKLQQSTKRPWTGFRT